MSSLKKGAQFRALAEIMSLRRMLARSTKVFHWKVAGKHTIELWVAGCYCSVSPHLDKFTFRVSQANTSYAGTRRTAHSAMAACQKYAGQYKVLRACDVVKVSNKVKQRIHQWEKAPQL